VDVPAVVHEVHDTLRVLVAQKGIAVAVELDPAVCDVVVDAAKLRQVLYNYLANALKFTPDGGRVWIRVMPDGEACFRVEVEDTGIGIDDADLERLFVEFQQLDAGAGKRYAGTGLGLALTRRYVEAHGGHVGVRSRRGQGSVFFAVLPRRPSAVTADLTARH
jgi:signal transduction histidine kinase